MTPRKLSKQRRKKGSNQQVTTLSPSETREHCGLSLAEHRGAIKELLAKGFLEVSEDDPTPEQPTRFVFSEEWRCYGK